MKKMIMMLVMLFVFSFLRYSHAEEVICPISNLTYSTTYRWYVNVSDGVNNVSSWYVFTTEASPWDINNDTYCNLMDFVVISNHYNESGNPGWIKSDVDKNGVVEKKDILFASMYYGGHWGNQEEFE